jgi:hypothetical protein
LIHPHIQGTLSLETEPPFRFFYLDRRKSQIKKHPIGGFCPEEVGKLNKVLSKYLDPIPKGHQGVSRFREGLFIPFEPDDHPIRCGPFQNL